MTMICPSCGSKNETKGTFCSACGIKLNESVTQSKTTEKGPNNILFAVLGWGMFVVSFLVIPILFGAGAFIMGYLLRKNGSETHGAILMVLAIAGAILGMLIGFIAGLESSI